MAKPGDDVRPRGAEPGRPASGARDYGLFTLVQVSWFTSWGMQLVLFSWLVVGELEERAELVGGAMLALVLPSLLFLLAGGQVGDRVDRRWLLLGLHVLASGLAFSLAFAVGAGAFSYFTLLGFAFAMGTVQAFAFPARDALLYDVSGSNLMRAVTGATLSQFASQSLGSLLAGGLARWIGTAFALAGQGVVLLLALPALLRLRATPPPLSSEPLRAGEMLAGLREVWRSEAMFPVLLLGVAQGLFFIGPFMVCFPLLVRDVYHGDVATLGLLTMTFPVGAVAASLWLIRRGRLLHKGRAIVLAQFGAALALIAISTGIPFPATFAFSLGWGVCGGVFLNAGRTVFQETALESHRARVLSVYTLGFMGGGALGSLLAGFLAAWLGPLGACATSAGAMLVCLVLASLRTRILRVR